MFKPKAIAVWSAGALLLVLAACGPAEVEQAANEGAATVEAVASDPTVEAVANEALTAAAGEVSDADIQAAVDEIFGTMNDEVALREGEALTFEALSSLPDVQNYKLTVVDAPAGAEASEGKVIKEASGGNISVNPDEYGQYFTVAGDYKVRLDVTTSSGTAASHEFIVAVP